MKHMDGRGVGAGAVLFIIALVAIVLAAMWLGGFLQEFAVPVNTDTRGWCASSTEGGGQFPDPPTPEDRNKKGEMLSKTTLYLAWTDTGVSEDLTVSGAVRACALAGKGYPTHRYVFDVNDGSGNKRMGQDDFPNGIIQPSGGIPGFLKSDESTGVSSRTIRIDGISYDNGGVETEIQDGAVLTVTMQGQQALSDVWFTLARDEVRMVRATPDIQRGADTFDLGDVTGFFKWSIPFTELEGRPAYFLRLTNDLTGAIVGGWDDTPLTNKSGRAEFDVATVLGAAKSVTVRAELFSPIFRADVTDVTTVDDKDLAPVVLSVSLNKREFREGDPVVVSFTTAPNPTTNSPVVRAHVLAHIGGDSLRDEFTESSSMQFIASRTGILAVEVYAVDEVGRASAVFEVEATVGNVIVDCEVHPELPKCGGGDSAWPGIVIGIILAVAGFMLIAFGRAIHFALFVLGLALAGIGLLLLAFALIDMITRNIPFIGGA